MQKWRNESFVDVVNLILGAWLFVTPWFYDFAGGAAGWNAWIMGGLIALLAIAALAAFAEWEEWINLLLGLWVLVAPWALGFAENVSAMGNHAVVGIVVAVLAAIELWLVHGSTPRVHARKREGRRTPALSARDEHHRARILPIDAVIQSNLRETTTRTLASLTPREVRRLLPAAARAPRAATRPPRRRAA